MSRKQSVGTRPLISRRYAAGAVGYLLLCGGILFAGAMLGGAAKAVSPRDLPIGLAPALEIPMARIQSLPDRNNLCRALVFHNDSGSYQEGPLGKCTIPKDMMVWTYPGRAEAFAEAFKAGWIR
jgi:hypothetical protein